MTKAPRRRQAETRELVRDALVRAGQTLFARHPVDALAVDDIVREAGVGKGSFYTYFADKDALLAAVVSRIRARIEAEVAVANRDVDDPASRVARGMCCYLRYGAEQPEHGAVLVRNGRSGEALPYIDVEADRGTQDDVRAGLAAGRFSAPSVEAGVLLVIGAGFAGLVRIGGGSDVAGHLRLAKELCQVVLRGLGLAPDEARRVADDAAVSILAADAAHRP